ATGQGGGPSARRAPRASVVSVRAAWTAARSRWGSRVSARSRPGAVAVKRASRSRKEVHPRRSPRVNCTSTDRPPQRLVLVTLPSLRLLAGRQRLALPPDARLLVVLPLLQFGEEPRLLALLLEALEGALEGLVGLHDDLRHVRVPPSVESLGTRLGKRIAYTTGPWRCPRARPSGARAGRGQGGATPVNASAASAARSRTSGRTCRSSGANGARTQSETSPLVAGRPTPTFTRRTSVVPSVSSTDASPRWPAERPRSRVRTVPNGKSMSSWTRTSAVRSAPSARRTSARAGPLAFMTARSFTRASGTPRHTASAICAAPTRRNGAPRRRASCSTTRWPTLCRVPAYAGPGFPSPTTTDAGRAPPSTTWAGPAPPAPRRRARYFLPLPSSLPLASSSLSFGLRSVTT